ncbi:VOC family protein [Steroidobacter flavus]|uniref:VOC family protein n=1 Tax=Steroidobacter flavus TaxID=1842136 RepID=A0ABV8SX73_9GAMM
MVKAVHHVGMSTADLERCIHFYRDLIGMELLSESQTEGEATYDALLGLQNVKARSAMLGIGSMRLELWEFEHPAGKSLQPMLPVNIPRITHLCFEVEDIQSDYQRLKEAGVRFHCPPQSFGGAEAVYGRDPEDNIFELVQWSGKP